MKQKKLKSSRWASQKVMFQKNTTTKLQPKTTKERNSFVFKLSMLQLLAAPCPTKTIKVSYWVLVILCTYFMMYKQFAIVVACVHVFSRVLL